MKYRYFQFYFLPGLLVLSLAIAFLFFVKNRVQELSRNVRTTNSHILSERESIYVLKAEYSYLTSPKRLKKLVDKHLDLKLPSTEKLIDLNDAAKFMASLEQTQSVPTPEALDNVVAVSKAPDQPQAASQTSGQEVFWPEEEDGE